MGVDVLVVLIGTALSNAGEWSVLTDRGRQLPLTDTTVGRADRASAAARACPNRCGSS